MAHPPRILAFGGSLRSASWNQRIAELAAASARKSGADVTILHLHDYPLPVYNQEIEGSTGLPDEAQALKALFREHDGFLISSPEYNGSLSAALKNTIDWLSRPEEGYPSMVCFKGKAAGLLSCSPGRLGGLRGLAHLRTILSGIGTHILPEQVAVPHVMDHFEDSDTLLDDNLQKAVDDLGRRLTEFIAALKC